MVGWIGPPQVVAVGANNLVPFLSTTHWLLANPHTIVNLSITKFVHAFGTSLFPWGALPNISFIVLPFAAIHKKGLNVRCCIYAQYPEAFILILDLEVGGFFLARKLGTYELSSGTLLLQ